MTALRPAQSRLASLFEAWTNLAVGYALAVVVQVLAFPLFDIVTTLADNAAIAGIFSLLSLIRSYLLRRLFEWIDHWPADDPTDRGA